MRTKDLKRARKQIKKRQDRPIVVPQSKSKVLGKISNVPMTGFAIPEGTDCSAIENEAIKDGELQILPAEFYAQFDYFQVALFCSKHSFYSLPTTELISWLKPGIKGKKAIEIGSGNGAIARALEIPATDSKLQTDPLMEFYYSMSGQKTVSYGANVEKLNAIAAIEEYKPDIVIGAWVTQLYKEGDTEDGIGSNMWGIDEQKILRSVNTYIMIGHDRVHHQKRILKKEHQTYRYDWLLSRSADAPDGNFIKVWTKD